MDLSFRNLWSGVIIILFLICLTSTIWLYHQKQEVSDQFEEAQKKWVKHRKDLVEDLDQTKESLEKFKAKLTNLRDKLHQTYTSLDSFKKKYQSLNEEVKQQRTKIANLQKELEDKEVMISKLRIKNEAYRKKLNQPNFENLSSGSSNEYGISDNFNKKLDNWGKEKDTLREKLVLLGKELKKVDVKKEDIITQIEEVNKLLESRIVKITKFRKSLETLMKESKKLAMERAFNAVSAVELPPIVIHKNEIKSPEQDKPERNNQGYPLSNEPRFTDDSKNEYVNLSFKKESNNFHDYGRILFVNQAQNFVVINMGKKDGVSKGMIFEVYRGEDRIGKVKVIEVRKRLSACNIEKVNFNEIITANDLVILTE